MVEAGPRALAPLREDPEFRAIYLEWDAAFDWSPDDPRIEALAGRIHRWMAGRNGKGGEWPGEAPPIAQLLTTSAGGSSPAWERLSEIAEQTPAALVYLASATALTALAKVAGEWARSRGKRAKLSVKRPDGTRADVELWNLDPDEVARLVRDLHGETHD